ncbi:hypothetical protein [Martelella sp. AD-3]|nr:hypothetical protein [Martelella sp. AD-3]
MCEQKEAAKPRIERLIDAMNRLSAALESSLPQGQKNTADSCPTKKD